MVKSGGRDIFKIQGGVGLRLPYEDLSSLYSSFEIPKSVSFARATKTSRSTVSMGDK